MLQEVMLYHLGSSSWEMFGKGQVFKKKKSNLAGDWTTHLSIACTLQPIRLTVGEPVGKSNTH